MFSACITKSMNSTEIMPTSTHMQVGRKRGRKREGFYRQTTKQRSEGYIEDRSVMARQHD